VLLPPPSDLNVENRLAFKRPRLLLNLANLHRIINVGALLDATVLQLLEQLLNFTDLVDLCSLSLFLLTFLLDLLRLGRLRLVEPALVFVKADQVL
jgi:hypothetical protein